MAKSINQVIVMGRLTRDPETRTTPTGRSVTNFGLAVDRQGQDDQADFFDVTAWEKTGELVSRYLSKGRRCLVQGRLRQDSWEDKETGKRRNRIEIVATDVIFLDGPSSGDTSGGGSAQNGGFQAGQNNQSSNQPIADIDDSKPIDLSEIPF